MISEKRREQNCNLAKETPILQHLKGTYIPGRLGDGQHIATQITVSKKNEIRLRRERLI